jgi:uncharacterized iron-regulated membrane protein
MAMGRNAARPKASREGKDMESILDALHMAMVFGLPYKTFVSALGLVVAMLSMTGVYIWWKKRAARRFRKRQGASTPPLEATPAE